MVKRCIFKFSNFEFFREAEGLNVPVCDGKMILFLKKKKKKNHTHDNFIRLSDKNIRAEHIIVSFWKVYIEGNVLVPLPKSHIEQKLKS